MLLRNSGGIISTQAPTDADLLSLLIDDALTKADPTQKVAAARDVMTPVDAAQCSPSYFGAQDADRQHHAIDVVSHMRAIESQVPSVPVLIVATSVPSYPRLAAVVPVSRAFQAGIHRGDF